MSTKQAHEIIRGLREAASADSMSLARRIVELKEDYERDPWQDTAAQIARLQDRMLRKLQEAEALAIAATRF